MTVMKRVKLTEDMLEFMEKVEEGRWLKIFAIGAGGLLTIWILGKSSKVIAQAITEFKILKNAIRA